MFERTGKNTFSNQRKERGNWGRTVDTKYRTDFYIFQNIICSTKKPLHYTCRHTRNILETIQNKYHTIITNIENNLNETVKLSPNELREELLNYQKISKRLLS